MKTKSLFLGALTCLAFAACSDDDKVVNPNGSQAENGTAVIAVSFSMPTGNANATKTWSNEDNEDNYAIGQGYETKVNTAMLYFYKGNTLWQAVDVIDNIEKWSDENVSNTIQLNSNVFITLENVSENNFPDKVVAVLNGPNNLSTSTFPELITNITKTLNTTNITSTTEGNFVMSNAVYNDGTTTMNYTPVSKNNFGTGSNITEAQNNAMTKKLNIIVERVLARVNVTGISSTVAKENTANIHAFATIEATTGKITSTSEKKAVLATLNGWWLDNTNSQSNLVKTLEPSYTFNYDGFNFTWNNWNDETNQRSYWATAVNSTATDNSKFQHYYYSQYNNQDKYCYENTNMDNPTRLVVAATLKIDGTAQDLVQHNTLMWTSADFLKNVEYQLKQQYKGITISSTNLKLVWNTQETATNGTITENNLETRYEDRNEIADNETREIKDYEAMVKVNVDGSTITESTTFSYTDANDVTQSFTIDQLNNAIEDILRGPVKFWNDGQTYFFTEIAQLEETAVVDKKNVKYILPGIIRNHLYKINITSVVGLGTPVPTEPQTPDPDPEYPEVPNPTPDPDPDPDQPIIPETPEDDEISAIAAQISILKYRVVNQSVDLQ